MEKLAARKDGFVSYVENICTNGSSSIDDPYFEIMSQYIAIKKAEEEVERNVGAYHFIEELERVTGKKAQALSFLTQTRYDDIVRKITSFLTQHNPKVSNGG